MSYPLLQLASNSVLPPAAAGTYVTCPTPYSIAGWHVTVPYPLLYSWLVTVPYPLLQLAGNSVLPLLQLVGM